MDGEWKATSIRFYTVTCDRGGQRFTAQLLLFSRKLMGGLPGKLS